MSIQTVLSIVFSLFFSLLNLFYLRNMATPDPRYLLIRHLYAKKKILSLSDIFKYVPADVVAKDIKMHTDNLNNRLMNVSLFSLQQIFQIGALCDLDERIIAELTLQEFSLQKDKGKSQGDLPGVDESSE